MKASQNQISHLNLLKTSTSTTYSSVNKIFCPILKTDIVFNSLGFRHLTIKPDGTYRDVTEAIYKLTLFPLAIPTIKNATAISDERAIALSIGRGKRRKYKKAKTYSLVAYVGKKKPVMVRVIIIQIGNGNHQFYSIMKN